MTTRARAVVDDAGQDGARDGAVLALDIGGTKLAAGVVDGSGRVHSFVVVPSEPQRGPDAELIRLFDLGRRAVDESGIDWEDIGAVGIGCGGPLDAARGVLLAPLHLPGWYDVPVTAIAEEAFERPAVLENDATAAAAAEHRYGAGAGARNMVYLTISTGVGGVVVVVVVDGRLYRGAGNGAELGHVTVDWRGRPCRGCGRPGCLEAYVSGTSIAERAREAIAESPGISSSLAALSDPTAEDVAEAARAGDELAVAIWDDTVAALACGLTSIVNVFERVVVGGGVSRVGEQLLGPVRTWVRANAMEPAGRSVDIVASALGDQVGVVGAAAVVFDRSGNGGSAADAQHLAAELVGRYKRDRRSLPAVALTVDPSVVTAIGNDYSFEDLFARQVERLVGEHDVVIGFTTSGRSENVRRGLAAARSAGATTVLFSGGDGDADADHTLVVPSSTTARVQEMHLLLMHLLLDQIDAWAAGEDGAT